jgi:hypothetical protein
MYTIKFWKDASERAVRTAAQVLVGFFGANTFGILEVDWAQAGSVAALAALTSLLMSVASTGVGNPESPSLIE